ncbi:MAG: ABC transporter ATP-binding protein [Verrucomicrobia bacterium]|nr:ABC transporter ATP-binding protein [Verrucomicrobiota bacterium]
MGAETAPTSSDAAPRGTSGEPLVEIRDLCTSFHTDDGVARAVDGIALSIPKGGTLGLVGESGCGKSVTALSIMRLIPTPPGRIERGEVRFEGRDLLTLPEAQMRRIRGNDISMIFQEPMTSLNPVFTCGDQIVEVLRLHQRLGKAEALDRAIEMLDKVGIPSPEQRVHEYPHQLSGGQKQRVMIAMALACNPKLLIADEPTTALDVTIQAQILDLLRALQAEFHMAILLITHDLGVIAEVAEQVAVMYAGKIAELAGVHELFADPKHPYTQGLFGSLPKLGKHTERLNVIPGVVPNPIDFPSGCKFHPRCPHAFDRCAVEEPGLRVVGDEAMGGGDHVAACHLYPEGER